MSSRTSFRGLCTVLVLVLFITPMYPQQQPQKAEADDSSRVQNNRFDSLIDDFLSSINNEVRLTLGQESRSHARESVFPDSTGTHDEFFIDGTDSTVTFSGDALIGINDTIRGTVVVRPGSLTINGIVEGNVIVYDGGITVNRGGIITGNATAVRGTITKNEGGTIGGILYETSEDPDDYASDHRANDFPRFDSGRHRRYSHWRPWTFPQYSLNWFTNSVSDFDPFILRYNRVDGLFLGVGKPEARPWETRKNFGLYGSLGYGFALHRWRYNLGLDLFPGFHKRIEAGIEYHDITDTRDSWIMNRNENSAAAFFIHEDFYDYFGRRGFNVHGSVFPLRTLRARIDYLADEYESLPWKTDWALFGGNKRFRPNPSISEGLMRSLALSVDYSTVDREWWERSGWDIHASAEWAGDSYGGDFSFNRYLCDVRRYQEVGDFSKLSTRVRVGSSTGILPYQKLFEFGGIGTLNAYRYKEFFGNRMFLVNVEYLLHGSTFDDADFWPLEMLSPFSLALFLDAGWATYVPAPSSSSDGFESLSWNTLKSDLGVGIGSRDGTLRIAWAWRTDQRSAPVFFFRISRPF